MYLQDESTLWLKRSALVSLGLRLGIHGLVKSHNGDKINILGIDSMANFYVFIQDIKIKQIWNYLLSSRSQKKVRQWFFKNLEEYGWDKYTINMQEINTE